MVVGQQVVVAEVFDPSPETADRLRIPVELYLRVHGADFHAAMLPEGLRERLEATSSSVARGVRGQVCYTA
jgi:hypothetical protein